MANPLKFEIQIGSQLKQQIEQYKAQLACLLKNRTITIGVDNKLTEIVTQLVSGFKDINKQQVESAKNLKSVTDFLEKQQKSLSGLAEAQQKAAQGTKEQSAAHKANEQAIKAEAEAQKQLNEQIKAQEAEVARLNELHHRAQERYSQAIQRNDTLNTPSRWDVLDGRLTNKQEAASWIASWAKKNATAMDGFYVADDNQMKQLLAAFEKRYKTLGNAKNVIKGLLNEGEVNFLRGSAYNTSFGQNNATIKVDQEALKAYKKEVRDAAKEEKEAEAAVDAAYKNLINTKAKLNQLQQQATASSQQSISATNKETEAYKQQEAVVNQLQAALEKLKAQRRDALNIQGRDGNSASWDAIKSKWTTMREAQNYMVSYMKRYGESLGDGSYHLGADVWSNLKLKLGERYFGPGLMGWNEGMKQLLSTEGGMFKSFGKSESGGANFTLDTEAVVNYAKERKNAAQTIKQADAEIAETEQKLSVEKQKLKQSAMDSSEAIQKQAAANEKLAVSQQKVQETQKPATGGQQSLWDISAAEKLKNELTAYAKEIDTIISKIQESVNNMGKGIDVSASTQKFREGVQELIANLEPFQKALSTLSTYGGDFAKVVPTMVSASEQLAKSLKEVGDAQKNANDNGKNKDNDQTKKAKDYLENLNKIDAALVKIGETQRQLSAAIARGDNAGTRTSDLQARLYALNELERTLNGFKSQGNIEGSILFDSRAVKDALGPGAQSLISEAQSLIKASDNAVVASAKIKTALTDIGEANSRLTQQIQRERGNIDVKPLQDAFDKLTDFRRQLSGDWSGRETQALPIIKEAEGVLKTVNGLISQSQQLASGLGQVNTMLKETEQVLSRLRETRSNSLNLGIADTTKIDNQINAVERFQDRLLSITDAAMSDSRAMRELTFAYKQVETEAQRVNREQISENKKKEANDTRTAAEAARDHANALKAEAESANRASVSVTELGIKMRQLQETQNIAPKNFDTSGLQHYLGLLEILQQAMQRLQNGETVHLNGQVFTSANDLKKADFYQNTVKLAAEENANAKKSITQANREAAQSTNQLAQEEQRLANAFNSATKEARGQSQVVGDLKSLMYQYFSVYGAQQFLTEMVNITGELELQRKSLEVILGSGTAASEMYSQLRDLSQQSPYSFEDLLKAHRQLAAFGIDAKNIYGTMKSLTDIGAGLDVPVERLILAYGHTKSYGYLSGIQNRQFETAGIDLVGALADLYNKRADTAKQNGQTANYVTRKDIFGMMRKKDIPFEDVQEVIMDLDKPGGKFYNMQERQYNTLGGKLRNLRNNYRIMMSEMGGSQRGVLMGIVDTVNDLTEHWEKYAKVILSVAAAYGVMKAAQMAAGRSVLSQTSAISTAVNTTLTGTRATNYLRTLDYGRRINTGTKYWNADHTAYSMGRQNLGGLNQFDRKPLSRMDNEQRWASAKEIAQNEKLTNLQKQRIALTARLNRAQRAYILSQAGIEPAQARYIARLGRMRRGLISLRLGFMQAATAVRSFMASFAQQAAFMAVFSVITSFFTRASDLKRRMQELADGFRDEAATNAKSAKDIVDNYVNRGWVDRKSSTYYDSVGSALTTSTLTLNKDAIKGIDLSGEIEKMKKKLETLSPFYDGDLFDIDKLTSQEEQFEALVSKIDSLRHVNEVLEATSDVLAYVDKRTAGGNWFTQRFGDTFTEDLQDYADKAKRFRNRFMEEVSNYKSDTYISDRDLLGIDKALNGELTDLMNNNKLGDLRSALQLFYQRLASMSRSENEKYRKKAESYKKTLGTAWLQDNNGKNALTVYNDLTDNSHTFRRGMESDWEQVLDDAKDWSEKVADEVKNNFGDDPGGAAAYMAQAVQKYLSFGGISNETDIQEVEKALIEKWNNRGQKIGNLNMGDFFGASVIKENFGNYLGEMTPGMTSKESDAKFKEAAAKAKSDAEGLGLDLVRIARSYGFKTVDAYLKSLYNSRKKAVDNMTRWQKRAVKMGFSVQAVIQSTDYTEFIKGQRKIIKDGQEKLNANRTALKFYLKTKVLPSFEFGNTESMRKFYNQIVAAYNAYGKQAAKLMARGTKKNGVTYYRGEDMPMVNSIRDARDFLKNMMDILSPMLQSGNYLDSEHQSFSDDKGGKDEKNAQTAANRAQKQRETAQRRAEAQQKRIENANRAADRELINGLQKKQKSLSDAYKTYWEWYERLGEDEQAAMAKVREKFKVADISNDDLKNLQTQEGYINLLLAFIKSVDEKAKGLHYKSENKDAIDNIKVSASETIDQTRQKQFDDSAKKYTSELDLQVKNLQKQYDLYKKIYDLTGDRSLAIRMSGRNVDYYGSYQTEADDMRSAIQNNVTSAVKDINSRQDNKINLPNIQIDFGKVLGLDDKNIKKYVGQLFQEDANGQLFDEKSIGKDGLQTLQYMIDGTVDKLKAWRDMQIEVNNASKQGTATIIGNLKDYGTLLQKVQQKYGDNRADINRQGLQVTDSAGGNINGADKGKILAEVFVKSGFLIPTDTREIANRANNADEAYDMFKVTPEYRKIIEQSITTPMSDIRDAALKAIQLLQDKVLAGTLSPEEYASQRDNIIKSVSTIAQNRPMGGFLSFLSGGMSGIYADRVATDTSKANDAQLEISKQTFNQQKADKDIEKYTDQLVKALKNGDYNGASAAMLGLTNANTAKGNAIQALKEAFGKKDDAEKNLQDDEKKKEKNDRLNKQIDAVIKGMQALQSAFSLLSNTFDSLGLGDTGFGSAMSDTSDLMGSMLGGASSLSALGPWGMAAGAGLGLISGLAGVHDKHQQKKIDKLQEDVSKIEGYTEVISKAQERTLGYSSRGSNSVISEYQRQWASTMQTIKTAFGNITVSTSGAAGKAMASYYNAAGTGKDLSVYQQQYNMLIQKRKDYIGMYNAENGKKKRSNSALQEYKEKIAELDDEIRYFAEDLANTLYGIDFKSWADQLGDALMTAFENGEDAAEAFDNSVTSILQSLVKKMVSVGIFEPLFERLRKQLFGENGKGGSFNISDPNGSRSAWMADINEALGDDGYVRKGAEAAKTLFDSMEGLANKYGNTLLNNNSATMSSSIKGITEQTADLLAAYLNAIRADVSVIRQLLSVRHVAYMEEMSTLAKSQVQYQSQIAANTLRNAEAAEKIVMSNDEILYLFRAVTNDTKMVSTKVR